MKTKTLFAIAMFVTGGLAMAQDLGQPTSHTPFDNYLGVMRTTLSSLGGNHPEVPEVEGYVKTGRGFRYYMKNPLVPQTPAETESTRAGDCKAKSLWVAYKMDDRTLRFVVGRAHASSGMNHAWLLWKGPSGWLILDATLLSTPIDVSRVGPNEYTPRYSYSASGKFVHAGATSAKPHGEVKYGDHA
ncbi:MAG: hypothetical protein ACJ8M4_05195 [Chthoniobacterales bacterium]